MEGLGAGLGVRRPLGLQGGHGVLVARLDVDVQVARDVVPRAILALQPVARGVESLAELEVVLRSLIAKKPK